MEVREPTLAMGEGDETYVNPLPRLLQHIRKILPPQSLLPYVSKYRGALHLFLSFPNPTTTTLSSKSTVYQSLIILNAFGSLPLTISKGPKGSQDLM
jgi:hypothetical protein